MCSKVKKESKTMELKDTVEMMLSEDYKERFKAEYYQIITRYNKLNNLLNKFDNGNLEFSLSCPRALYDAQIKAMEDYIYILKVRALIENIDL